MVCPQVKAGGDALTKLCPLSSDSHHLQGSFALKYEYYESVHYKPVLIKHIQHKELNIRVTITILDIIHHPLFH
jgi:hypothetical protein